MVQTQLPEHVFIRWCLLCFMESVPYLVDGDRLIQRRIRLIPVLFIRPVTVIRQSENHRIKPRIFFPAFQDIHRLLMHFPTDAVPVCSSGGQQKPQRLLPGITAALRHDIVQGTVRLRMQLVKDTGADIQAMLGGHLTGQHLVNTARWLVHHSLRGWDDLDPFAERRGLFHHIHSHVKHNRSLLAVRRAGIDFCPPFIIIAEHIQGNGSAKL